MAILEHSPGKKKTLVLDLDETIVKIIHVENQKHRQKPCIEVIGAQSPNSRVKKIKILTKDNRLAYISIKFRPFLRQFLTNMAKLFEIVVFTASTKAYASQVVSSIDPDGEIIRHTFSREHCLKSRNGFLIKDLRLLGNRDLKNIVIIDNLVHSFGL